MKKTIVVTGGTQGIGKAIILKFAANGYNIAVYSRKQANIDALQQAVKAINTSVEFLGAQIDASDQKSVQSFCETVIERFGNIDVLVNNAGIFAPGNVHDYDATDLENMMQVNVFSALSATKPIAASMKSAKSGSIFNICSVAGLQAYPGGGIYSLTKYAINGFSKALRLELQDHQVKVTTIFPGATLTNSWAGTDLPKNRFMPAEDVAEVVWSTHNLSARTVIEEIVLRPQLGDI